MVAIADASKGTSLCIMWTACALRICAFGLWQSFVWLGGEREVGRQAEMQAGSKADGVYLRSYCLRIICGECAK